MITEIGYFSLQLGTMILSLLIVWCIYQIDKLGKKIKKMQEQSKEVLGE